MAETPTGGTIQGLTVGSAFDPDEATPANVILAIKDALLAGGSGEIETLNKAFGLTENALPAPLKAYMIAQGTAISFGLNYAMNNKTEGTIPVASLTQAGLQAVCEYYFASLGADVGAMLLGGLGALGGGVTAPILGLFGFIAGSYYGAKLGDVLANNLFAAGFTAGEASQNVTALFPAFEQAFQYALSSAAQNPNFSQLSQSQQISTLYASFQQGFSNLVSPANSLQANTLQQMSTGDFSTFSGGLTQTQPSGGNYTQILITPTSDGSISMQAVTYSNGSATAVNAMNIGDLLGPAEGGVDLYSAAQSASPNQETICLPSGQTITISGVQLLTSDGNGGYLITGSSGVTFNLDPLENTEQDKITGPSGISAILDSSNISNILLNSGNIQFTLLNGGTATANQSTGTNSYSYGGNTATLGTGELYIGNNQLGTGTDESGLGHVFSIDTLLPNGTLQSDPTQQFIGDDVSATFSIKATDVYPLETAVNSDVVISQPTATPTNTVLTTITVAPLGTAIGGNANGDNTDAGYVPVGSQGGYVIVGAGVSVTTSTANATGLFNDSPNDEVTGEYKPGDTTLMDPSQNATDQVEGDLDFYGQAQAQAAALQSYYSYLADIASQAYTFTDTDPLLIDLTGNGIQLTNWIDNATYFDTNLNAAGNGADRMQHHTSWVNSGTGILALDLNGDGKIDNITETLSEFFAGGSTPYHYADGLAALASLATAGATSFSAATSKTDSATGKLYWNEIVIAQGTPDVTGALEVSQLETLAAAGISSISLVGSGNTGESLAGSAVTNRTTATTSSGGTDQVAAVSFQTDTTGDITYSQNGGVVINSTPEGGATANTSYIDENASAQTLALSSGKLTDDGTTVAQHNGEAYNAVFAQGTDTVTVASGDTSSYWLSGGTGTTLNASGAKGNIRGIAYEGF